MNGWIVTNPGLYTLICVLCGAAVAVGAILIGWIMGDHAHHARYNERNKDHD